MDLSQLPTRHETSRLVLRPFVADDWAPYAEYQRRQQQLSGLNIELTEALAKVLGVELSADAITAARRSALEAGLADRVRFEAGDATAAALGAASAPDLVIVNPPRRGIGPELAAWLEGSGVGAVLYSSCNPESLAVDLGRMPSLAPVRARLFDMFPQMTHAEVLVLLTRAGAESGAPVGLRCDASADDREVVGRTPTLRPRS